MPDPDPLARLGVTLGSAGGELRVFSATATAMELCLFDDIDANWVIARLPMTRDEAGVWSVHSSELVAGMRYAVRASGPTTPGHAFDPELRLIDPYARGLARSENGEWRGYVQEPDTFDWGHSAKPRTAPDQTVLYEAHVKGLSKLNPTVPAHLRGTYAGLAHESTIAYLKNLGVTAIELLPVHQFVSEQRLIKQGLINYWGYNTLNFFTPHAAYASREAQLGGTGAVLREFKGMVKLLHEAGLEVILDVVYNHTAEEGLTGPTTSLRGLDNSSYYRHTIDGKYVDVTGCGNSINTAHPAAQRLILDSLRYWANDVQIDGFRFDLAATLGRNAANEFDPQHPLLLAIRDDPALSGVRLISEPWDVGMGGWQVGNFPEGWSEWNDGYRDQVRDFWLTDIGATRAHGSAPSGIGSLARRLTGSAHVFSSERGPIASVNFITAHDGFTLADLTAYNTKHNVGNGEDNRDGTSNNHSFNYGVEGPTTEATIRDARHKAIRNLLGTLLFSAGIPMLTAGDEYGRSQRGNNNAYNQDSELTWLSWEREEWQDELLQLSHRLIRFRRDNPALRPMSFGSADAAISSATHMNWYNKEGLSMSDQDWDSPQERTLQYLATATPENGETNRILIIVHGLEEAATVTLPPQEGITAYSLLWDSAISGVPEASTEHLPGTELSVAGASMQLFTAR
ncbi:MAG: glycogen debranching protein GlgX [Rhodoglobus sp.]